MASAQQSSEKSMVGSPIEEAQQALKDKYDRVKESMEMEKQQATASTGLKDAKTMLRDEYQDAKKSMSRHEGAPEAADASDTSKLIDQKVSEELEEGAQRMLDEGAPDTSLNTHQEAINKKP